MSQTYCGDWASTSSPVQTSAKAQQESSFLSTSEIPTVILSRLATLWGSTIRKLERIEAWMKNPSRQAALNASHAKSLVLLSRSIKHVTGRCFAKYDIVTLDHRHGYGFQLVLPQLAFVEGVP